MSILWRAQVPGAGCRAAVPAWLRAGHRHQGRAVRVDPIEPSLKASRSKRLKVEHDKLLSNSAFNFNLRRFIKVVQSGASSREKSFQALHKRIKKHLGAALPSPAGAYTRPLLSST